MALKDIEIDYLQDCLDDGTDIDFVSYIKSQKIEKRPVFDRYFKSIVETLLADDGTTGRHDIELVRWAQTVVDNEFEILDRKEVLDYWIVVENKKVHQNLKYSTLVRLNNQIKTEAYLIASVDTDGILTRKVGKKDKRAKTNKD